MLGPQVQGPQVQGPQDRPIAPPPDLAALMTIYGARLKRYFARRAPPADVDDLVQDVFLHLQSAHPCGPIADIEPYLFTVAHNALISLRRYQTARRRGFHDALEDVPEPRSDLSPERILVGRQDYARAVKAIHGLPPRTRAAFRMHRFEDMTYAAIAERMGISRESVKELLHRASTGLKNAMRQDSS